MELNKEACNAAQLAFDKAWSEFDGQPTVLQRMGALNEALQAYESVRLAAAPASQQEASERALNQLYGAIMNLPNGEEFANFESHPNTRLAYKVGHRDARHKACDLVAEFASQSRAQRTTEGK